LPPFASALLHKCSILRPGSLASKGIQTRLVLAARLDLVTEGVIAPRLRGARSAFGCA